ncbi:MAG: DUF835 domain-containing protein [Candidatus Methanofastidiosia archaeon]
MQEKKGMESELEKGHVYLIKERNRGKSLSIFLDLLSEGIPGLFVTRQHPKRARELCAPFKIEVIWLSEVNSKESIDPSNLAKLTHSVIEFIKENKDSVVLFDNFEYLTIMNSFHQTLKHLYLASDFVKSQNSRLLLPINPVAFNEREQALLDKETKELKMRA